MLKKLFYYEWKKVSRTLLLPHLAVLLMVATVSGLSAVPALAHLDWFLLVFQAIAAIFSTLVPALTFCYFGVRYYQGLYSDQGYLTHTLPVTPTQLILSRFFCGVIWYFIDMALLLLSISLLTQDNLLGRFLDMWSKQPEQRSYLLIFPLIITVSLLMGLLTIYAGISIGSLFRGHRILGSVAAYLALYFIMQAISLIVLLFYFPAISVLPKGNVPMEALHALYPQAERAILNMCLTMSAVYFLAGVALFFLTRYLVDWKLSLE